MQKYIKSLITGFVVIAIFSLFAVPTLFAANASFNDNGAPGENDLATVLVRNKTVEGSCTTSCSWHDSTTANPGDIVTAQIYYHNTSETTTAVGVKAKLSNPTGSARSFTLSGSISASNASTSNGSANISISGSQNQTLTYIPGTVYWYAEKPLVSKSLTGSANDLFSSSGLSLGSVLPWGSCTVPGPYYHDSFCHRGFVTAQFKVSENAVSQGSNCTIDSYSVTDSSIDYGDSTTLHWTTSDCDRVTISGIGNVNTDGSVSTGSLYNDKTFEIEAYETNEFNPSDTDSKTVYVNDQQNNDECTIDSFYASDTHIDDGDSTTLHWTTTDCNYVSINSIGSNLNEDDSESTGSLYSDRTYTIHAYGDNGDDTDSETVYVDDMIKVTYACNDGRDNDGDGRTDLNDAGCSSVFDNDEYNYIYVPPVYVPQPVVQTHYVYTNTVAPVAVGNSLVEITIDSRYETVNIGENIDYTVTYKNKSNRESFQDVVISVLFPQNVDFVKSQQGTYSPTDNTLTIQLGTLAPNESGSIYFTGKVKNSARVNDLLVTSATLAFKNFGNSLDTAIAYETNTVTSNRNGNFLGAWALFGDNGILPTTFIGWLLLILIIMGIIYLARKMYSQNSNTKSFNVPMTVNTASRPYTPPATNYSDHHPIATPPHDLPH